MVEVAGVNQSRRSGQEGQPAADVVTGGFWMWPGSGSDGEKEVKRQLLAGCAENKAHTLGGQRYQTQTDALTTAAGIRGFPRISQFSNFI